MEQRGGDRRGSFGRLAAVARIAVDAARICLSTRRKAVTRFFAMNQNNPSAPPKTKPQTSARSRYQSRSREKIGDGGHGEPRVGASVLRHLGWWELCEHYRLGLRSSGAQARVAEDIDWLMSDGSDHARGDRETRSLVLDPDRKLADSQARLDELDGLEVLQAFGQPSGDEVRNRGAGRPQWSDPGLLESLRDIEDLQPSLKAASGGDLLSLPEMVGVRACLYAGAKLQGSLRHVRERCEQGLPQGSWVDESTVAKGLDALRNRLSKNHALADNDDWIAPDGALLQEIERCIDPHGLDGGPVLDDGASETLRQARQELKRRKAALVARAESFVRQSELKNLLQDRFWTEREGRVVLPLRSDAFGTIKDGTSIVHGASASGQTLFVEPRELVISNNEVRQAEMRVRTEEHRIMLALTRAIVADTERILAIQNALIELDFVAARLALGERLDARRPELFDPGYSGHAAAAGEERQKPELELIAARHPLMLLRGIDVVPNDVRIGVGQALIITGPNAGGKTVALKTVGLCVLMARAGLRIPTQRSGRVPAFLRVVTDVGDDQSIVANLSTFSAHITHVSSALAHAQIDGPRTLALFDEIAVGTDPEQGAALAEAILFELVRRGATILVTTHYDRLKLLATRNQGALLGAFQNAAVGFDLEKMLPTFRLTLGVPGSSSALALARRLGIPRPVLDQAEKLMGNRHRDMERLLVTLDDERRRLDVLREELAGKARKLETRERELATREHRLEEQKKVRQQKAADAATQALWDLEEELSQQRKSLRKAGIDPDTVLPTKDKLTGSARSTIEAHRQREAALGEQGAERTLPQSLPLAVGHEVRLRSTGTEGKVLAIRGEKVTIQFPLLRSTVDRSEVEAIDPAQAKRTKVRQTSNAPIKTWAKSDAAKYFGDSPQKAPSNPDTCLDLRGQRADDALALMELGLDEALLMSREVIVVVHGHGTGELRRVVRNRLRELAHVRQIRAGLPAEGGDAVTVVWVDA
jgi:DNA mismatch repair protein MutS2